jgi:hypothetical protein
VTGLILLLFAFAMAPTIRTADQRPRRNPRLVGSGQSSTLCGRLGGLSRAVGPDRLHRGHPPAGSRLARGVGCDRARLSFTRGLGLPLRERDAPHAHSSLPCQGDGVGDRGGGDPCSGSADGAHALADACVREDSGPLAPRPWACLRSPTAGLTRRCTLTQGRACFRVSRRCHARPCARERFFVRRCRLSPALSSRLR